MKKVLIGGFFSLIGSIWALTVVFVAGNNMVSMANPSRKIFDHSGGTEFNICIYFIYCTCNFWNLYNGS